MEKRQHYIDPLKNIRCLYGKLGARSFQRIKSTKINSVTTISFYCVTIIRSKRWLLRKRFLGTLKRIERQGLKILGIVTVPYQEAFKKFISGLLP
jgi:hypothetical protein